LWILKILGLQASSSSNEITAIPQVLELIDVRGAVITIDAMGAQAGIVKAITERGGDVVVCLKGNQGPAFNLQYRKTSLSKRNGWA
jgi:predicted transposase YbfD/YdcC